MKTKPTVLRRIIHSGVTAVQAVRKTASITLTALTLLLLIPDIAQAQDWLWASRAGGPSSEVANGIAVDASGNAYVTGSFSGTATFGTVNLVSAGSGDIFVAKYDSNGNCLWAKQAGSNSSSDRGFSIAVDASGNSYVTGSFFGTATFGMVNLVSAGSGDIFVAKYDSNGNCLWAKQAGGTSSLEIGVSIAVDASGNTSVTGFFSGTATFGTVNLVSAGGTDIFVAKYDPSGNCLWARQAGSASSEQGNGITVDASGNSYVTGFFGETVTFGSVNLESAVGTGFFVAKYNPSGNCLWAKQASGGIVHPASPGKGITVDANGNTYVTGNFVSNATFGTVNLISAGGSDIFVAKYDPSGNFQWAVKVGSARADQGKGIALDASGNIYVTGLFGDTTTFGTVNLVSAGSGDIFVAKLGQPQNNAPVISSQPQTQTVTGAGGFVQRHGDRNRHSFLPMAEGRGGHPECDGQHLQHRQRATAEHRLLHLQGDGFRGHGHEPAGCAEYQ